MGDSSDKKSGLFGSRSKESPPGAGLDSRGRPARTVGPAAQAGDALKRLDRKDLAIVEQLKVVGRLEKDQIYGKQEAPRPKQTTQGFNPYNSVKSVGTQKPEASPRKPLKDIRKLDQWIKLKRSMEEKKD